MQLCIILCRHKMHQLQYLCCLAVKWLFFQNCVDTVLLRFFFLHADVNLDGLEYTGGLLLPAYFPLFTAVHSDFSYWSQWKSIEPSFPIISQQFSLLCGSQCCSIRLWIPLCSRSYWSQEKIGYDYFGSVHQHASKSSNINLYVHRINTMKKKYSFLYYFYPWIFFSSTNFSALTRGTWEYFKLLEEADSQFKCDRAHYSRWERPRGCDLWRTLRWFPSLLRRWSTRAGSAWTRGCLGAPNSSHQCLGGAARVLGFYQQGMAGRVKDRRGWDQL